jgi:hypothetical protein
MGKLVANREQRDVVREEGLIKEMGSAQETAVLTEKASSCIPNTPD